MSIADILGFGCWPLIALGGTLLFASSRLAKTAPRTKSSQRKLARSRSDVVLWIGVLCIGVPMFLITIIYKNDTELFSFDTDIFYVMIGALFLIASRELSGKTAALPVAVVIGLIGLGAWYLVGDFLLPRSAVAGTVTRTHVVHGKAGPSYYVAVDGHSHHITADLFEIVRLGDRVEAQAGQASGIIYRLKTAR